MGKKAGMASSLRHWRATITDGNANDGATKAKGHASVATPGSEDVDVYGRLQKKHASRGGVVRVLAMYM